MQQKSHFSIITSNKSNSSYLEISTILENFRKIPRSEFRSNKYKIDRELWCVAKMLERLSLDNHRVCANPKQADSADIFVINSNHTYKIQVTEIAPKHQAAQVEFSGALACGYSSLRDETLKLLLTVVREKEIYSDIQDLNLLIYFNTPIGEKISDTMSWTILLENELDFDFSEIKSSLADSKFGSILLLTSDGTIFLKNNKLV